MSKTYKFLVVIALLFTTALYAQKFTISGVVKDASTGENMEGANVYIKGTTIGAATNSAGEYSLSADKDNYVVRCSFVGFETQEVSINLTNNMELNFSLIERQFTLSVTVLADRAKERETPVAFTNVG